jgi:uncharacterized protein YkwD
MRPLLLASCLAILALAACSTSGAGPSPFQTALATVPGTVDSGEAAALISRYRASKGLGPVTVDPTLTAIAAEHARRMAAASTMTHQLPGEPAFQRRLTDAGFIPQTAGENVAAGQKDLATVLEAWRKSPGHNANLLLPGATKIGIAVSVAPGSTYKEFWSLEIGERYVPPPGGAMMGGPMGTMVFPSPTGATVEIN